MPLPPPIAPRVYLGNVYVTPSPSPKELGFIPFVDILLSVCLFGVSLVLVTKILSFRPYLKLVVKLSRLVIVKPSIHCLYISITTCIFLYKIIYILETFHISTK